MASREISKKKSVGPEGARLGQNSGAESSNQGQGAVSYRRQHFWLLGFFVFLLVVMLPYRLHQLHLNQGDLAVYKEVFRGFKEETGIGYSASMYGNASTVVPPESAARTHLRSHSNLATPNYFSSIDSCALF